MLDVKKTQMKPFFLAAQAELSIAFKFHKKNSPPVISGRDIEMIPKWYEINTGGGRKYLFLFPPRPHLFREETRENLANFL